MLPAIQNILIPPRVLRNDGPHRNLRRNRQRCPSVCCLEAEFPCPAVDRACSTVTSRNAIHFRQHVAYRHEADLASLCTANGIEYEVEVNADGEVLEIETDD